MQDTPKSNRLHIAIFGKRNAGKSSIINALTNQEIALVSDVAGTTTDPVYKAMEILPIGPVVMIDTAGIDDEGTLGKMRVQKTYEVLNKTELAILVITAKEGITDFDREIIDRIQQKKIPIIGVINKMDREPVEEDRIAEWKNSYHIPFIKVSAAKREGIETLKQAIIENANIEQYEKVIVGDLIEPHDWIVLVTPIDKAAPKGRIILPQQQTIRDILDHGAMAIVTRETELKQTLHQLGTKPKMVITDSQVFAKVNKDVPREVLLTSFSILFARYKGDLEALVLGAKKIKQLKPGDHILICEGCSHHKQEGDIGRDKIPKWMEEIVGGKLYFEWTAGGSYPEPYKMKQFDLIMHCGGCMLNPKEMEFRIQQAVENGIPIINYGVFIAFATGILDRVLEPFPEAQQLWTEGESI
jgi:[FeFe] hydrogenase H-cluster maturation GTPase HydF